MVLKGRKSTVVTDEHNANCPKNRLSLKVTCRGEAETSENNILYNNNRRTDRPDNNGPIDRILISTMMTPAVKLGQDVKR